tara:strand:- start:403 stop:960 length:558 start_codon:yes stop_codon:yes gene_type:complete
MEERDPMEELADKIYQGLKNCSRLTNNPQLLVAADQKRTLGTWIDSAVEMHIKENPHILKWHASDFYNDSHRDAIAEETGLTGIELDAEMQARWLDEVMMHGELNAGKLHAPLMICSKFREIKNSQARAGPRPKKPTTVRDLSAVAPAEMTVTELMSELTRIGADTRTERKPKLIARLLYARQNS